MVSRVRDARVSVLRTHTPTRRHMSAYSAPVPAPESVPYQRTLHPPSAYPHRTRTTNRTMSTYPAPVPAPPTAPCQRTPHPYPHHQPHHFSVPRTRTRTMSVYPAPVPAPPTAPCQRTPHPYLHHQPHHVSVPRTRTRTTNRTISAYPAPVPRTSTAYPAPVPRTTTTYPAPVPAPEAAPCRRTLWPPPPAQPAIEGTISLLLNPAKCRVRLTLCTLPPFRLLGFHWPFWTIVTMFSWPSVSFFIIFQCFCRVRKRRPSLGRDFFELRPSLNGMISGLSGSRKTDWRNTGLKKVFDCNGLSCFGQHKIYVVHVLLDLIFQL